VTQTFLIAFVFSFVGSLPPGAINLSVLQMSVEHRISAAFRFTLAAVMVEIPYAWIAIKFQYLLTNSPYLIDNFKLIASMVLILMGLINIWSLLRQKPSQGRWKLLHVSGFRKGTVIAILNPMYIPFWLGVTAYLVHHKWVRLGEVSLEISFLLGVALGSFSLLAILILLGKFIAPHFRKREGFQFIPGIAFLLLGVYGLLEYFHIL
jgi:threonine/homoserine/homoserine lactone efflux protein